MAILNDNEFTEFEGRNYLNPQIALDESNTFIDNLRATQQTNNQQIQTDTYNLGTEIPSNLGGLTGSESYFSSRYQTPQTNAATESLRAAAQATALNQALSNEEAMWKKRYQDAYRAYQKRAWDKSNTTGGSDGSDDGDDPEYESTSSEVESPSVEGKSGYYTVVDPATGQIIDVPMDGSSSGSVREVNRYRSPEQEGYVLIGTPWYGAGTPGQHVYNTPSGGTLYVDLAEGYKIVYDSETGKLVQIKE